MADRLRVGLVGAGAIGAVIAKACDHGALAATVELLGICDLDTARRDALLADLQGEATALDLATMCDAADLVVEAAGRSAAAAIARAAFAGGADVMLMSVAALLLEPALLDEAREHGRRVLVPTGAIAGLDAIRAAAIGGLDEVTLTTTKPPRGLAGAPFFEQHPMDLEAVTEPTVVFEGNALEAVAGFPANVNVAAALSLAGLGGERTRVRIVVDPHDQRNRHRIEAVGACGRLSLEVENVPSPDNPKTSYLAALSALALLQRLSTSLAVGS